MAELFVQDTPTDETVQWIRATYQQRALASAEAS